MKVSREDKESTVKDSEARRVAKAQQEAKRPRKERKEAHRRLESIAAMAERNCSDLAGYVETIREGDLWKKLADDWETFCLEYFGRPARFVDCLVAGVKALEVAP